MKKRVVARFTLFGLSFVGGLVLFGWILAQQDLVDIAETVKQFGVLPFIGFVSISLLNFALYSWRWQLIINRHVSESRRIPLHRMYLHRMGGYAMSYLTPAAQVGGEPVRIALLSNDKANLREATSSVLLDVAFELVAYILFILAGVVFALVGGVGASGSTWAMVAGLSLPLLFLLIFLQALATGKGVFSRLFAFLKLERIHSLQNFEKSILDTERMMQEFLSKNRKLVGLVAFLSMAVISFRIVETFYISYFFGVSLNFAEAFLVSTIPGVALVLPVPAGLGVFEGSFAALFSILSIPLNAVAFAFIIRGRDVIFIFIGVLHIFLKGSEFLRRKILGPVVH